MYQNAISYPDLNVKVDAFVYLIFFSWNNVKQHGSTEYINGKLRVGFRYRTTRPHKQPIYQTKYIVLPFLLEFSNDFRARMRRLRKLLFRHKRK